VNLQKIDPEAGFIGHDLSIILLYASLSRLYLRYMPCKVWQLACFCFFCDVSRIAVGRSLDNVIACIWKMCCYKAISNVFRKTGNYISRKTGNYTVAVYSFSKEGENRKENLVFYNHLDTFLTKGHFLKALHTVLLNTFSMDEKHFIHVSN